MAKLAEKTFVTSSGVTLGRALLPEDYITSGTLNERWQSEMVPFAAIIRAHNPSNSISLMSKSKDLHTDLRNPLLKTVAVLVQQHTESGYDKYRDPVSYITEFASKQIDGNIHLVAEAILPSPLAFQPQLAKDLLNNDKNMFDMFLEIQSSHIGEPELFSRLYRYEGRQSDGTDIVILVGMDYQCAQLSYGSGRLSEVADGLKKMINTTREKLGLEEMPSLNLKEKISEAGSALKSMTRDDLMKGGLIGKMLRNKKNTEPKESKQVIPAEKAEVAVQSNDEKKGDLILYGAQRIYMCVCTPDKEDEAMDVFVTFVRSLQPEESLQTRESEAITKKMSLIRQQAAVNQNIAMQKQMQLRQMQMQTSQMIARNARQASDGLMDSWNRKMASDSRISQSYSEAIRGVNTYTNSYGQNVDVSVAADHIYENRYGDVYGVSGGALDAETLNNLNWKKIG
ncbi:MAG: hypothetical protein IJM15_04570 [Erysipelotrichaceae bacterium]|nr:hypothetical protein [Erysipelotrichaceae bacterium]